MPEISRFFGIIISMYYKDHQPPHFHAQYGEYLAGIRIQDFSVFEGKLPPRALGLVIEWASMHRDELMEDWNDARNKKDLKHIDPLR